MTDPVPDPDGPLNPDAPDLDLDVPVPGSPSETTADDSTAEDSTAEETTARSTSAEQDADTDSDAPEPPD